MQSLEKKIRQRLEFLGAWKLKCNVSSCWNVLVCGCCSSSLSGMYCKTCCYCNGRQQDTAFKKLLLRNNLAAWVLMNDEIYDYGKGADIKTFINTFTPMTLAELEEPLRRADSRSDVCSNWCCMIFNPISYGQSYASKLFGQFSISVNDGSVCLQPCKYIYFVCIVVCLTTCR